MTRHTFDCIDAHTCGNPVRVVAAGGPELAGANMIERRQDFLAHHDWVRTGLMFEPRGHEVMSGSILYPSTRDDCDVAILFIEVSGCLPMCGHGTIGTVTVAIEEGLVVPKTEGVLRLDTPAGVVEARYERDGARVRSVRLRNIPSYLHARGLKIDAPGLGEITFDIAYGGNFYAIIEPQENVCDMADMSPGDIQRLSPLIRTRINEEFSCVHPEAPAINGLSHIMWTGKPTKANSTARNAVFYGDKAIDRSPCGTGTSARMAQWAARGDLQQGQEFVHESIIGSQFIGRIEEITSVGDFPAIVPSIEGWAHIHGINKIFIDDQDPFAHGFLVT